MRRSWVVAALVLLASPLAAQRVIESYRATEGVLRIGPELEAAIAMVPQGHTFVLPDSGPIHGTVVQLDGFPVTYGPEDPTAGSFDAAALDAGLAVLHITTGNRLDFYFDDTTMANVARRIQSLLESEALHQKPVYFVGLSLGGTRALKLAVFLEPSGSRFWLRTSAVAVVDAPLDMIRMWHAEQTVLRMGYHRNAIGEARWVTYLLQTNLGGTPDEARERYIEYSPYTHGAPDGGNAKFLKDLPLRAYHEPDVDWWMANRRKSYYEMNSLDLAALVTELQAQGNDRAELVTTHQQRAGYEDGSSPHTWSFVDNDGLVAWLLSQAP